MATGQSRSSGKLRRVTTLAVSRGPMSAGWDRDSPDWRQALARLTGSMAWNSIQGIKELLELHVEYVVGLHVEHVVHV